MRLEPPEKVSEEKLTFDVREIEPLLQAPPMDLKPWPEAMVTLKDGRTLYIREARVEDAPAMIGYMKRVMEADHDFYDIVGVRVCAEIMGWFRKRLKDPYVLVGLIDGLWVGFANGRLMNEDIHISHHTVALTRGGRIGAVMYYAKAYYGFEILGSREFWSTPESYNGWNRYILGMAQQSYSWPEHQHELGGSRIYYITKKYWDCAAKKYMQQMMGTDLNFNVTNEVRERNKVFCVPEEITV